MDLILFYNNELPTTTTPTPPAPRPPNWFTSTKSISSSLLIFTCCRCPSAMPLILMLMTSGSWWLSSLYLICKLPAGINREKSVVYYIHNRQLRSHAKLPASWLYLKNITVLLMLFNLFRELTKRIWHKWEMKGGNVIVMLEVGYSGKESHKLSHIWITF